MKKYTLNSFPTVLDRVKKKDIKTEPFPYLLVKDVLPETLVKQLIAEYPGLNTTTKGKDFRANQRHSFSAFDMENAPKGEISQLWKDFTTVHTSQRFLNQVLKLFGDSIKKNYPNFEEEFGRLNELDAGARKIDSFKNSEVLLDSQVCVNTPVIKPSRVRGVHLDNPDKLFFGIFYLRPPGDTSRGSELEFYKFKAGVDPTTGKPIFAPTKDVDHRHLDFLQSFEYQTNALFLCVNTPNALHGVSIRESTKNPRLFVNLLGEVERPLFKIRKENAAKFFLRRNNLIKNKDIAGRVPSPYESGFYDKGKKSIVFFNHQHLGESYVEINETHNILYPRDIKKLTKTEKKSIEGLLIGKGKELPTKAFLKEVPNVKVAGIASGSFKKFKPEILLREGIPLLNVSDTYAEAVAEYTLMMALVGVRNAHASFDVMRNGGWGAIRLHLHESQREFAKKVVNKTLGKSAPGKYVHDAINSFDYLLFHKLMRMDPKMVKVAGAYNKHKKEYNASRKTLKGASFGIVGYGSVARELIRLLKPFNCEILINSNHLSTKEAKELGVEKASMEDICSCDVISIHRGLSEKTKHSFGAKEIAMIRPGAVLVNTSRGAVIDQKALVKRLKKRDMTACLDVFEKEPLSRGSSLRKMPNVFLTSHIANGTDETYSKSIINLSHDVLRYIKGDRDMRIIKDMSRIKTMS